MEPSPQGDLTRLLRDASAGDREAADALLPRIYDTLRALARRQIAREGRPPTLEPTALVHEAWFRLMGNDADPWEHRGHFFGAAAVAMRRILVERARKARRAKHGGDRRRVGVEAEVPAAEGPDLDEVLALEDLLEELARLDPRKHEIVMLRYYAGLTIEETARVLEVAPATVKADWSFVRSWLRAQLRRGPEP